MGSTQSPGFISSEHVNTEWMTPPYLLCSHCSCLWHTRQWKGKEQPTNVYNSAVFKAEKGFIIICFIPCNSVNRLSKAQKNGSRWMNSTILTLAVCRLHEGSVRKNIKAYEQKWFLSFYEAATLGKYIWDVFRFLWLNCIHMSACRAPLFWEVK